MDVVENSVSDAATASVQSAAPPAIALIANSDSPDVEALVDAFLEHVDLGRLLYSVFKHTVRFL